jgi:dimethylargininase
LVFGEGAIVLRPGAASRLGEAAELAPVLRRRFGRVMELGEAGFADGGDILVTQAAVLIGLSARTDAAGAAALIERLASLGRPSRVVTTPPGVLHFKSDCSLLDEETVLSTGGLAKSGVFADFRIVETPDGEEAGANALRVNGRVLVGKSFPRTADLLASRGYDVVALPTDEIGKVDAGLSCMSLRWYAGP